MQELLKAIVKKFNNDTTLLGLFPNGLHLGKAPDAEESPSCVLTIQGGFNEYTTTSSYLENCQLNFTVRRKNDDGFCLSSGEIIASTFDNIDLDMDTDKSVAFRRNGPVTTDIEDMFFWRSDINYNTIVSR